MAKKEKEVELEKNENDELDFEDINFDDLDLDEFDEGIGEREPSKLEIAKDVAKETSKSFFESLSKKTLEKTLPNSYSENYYTALEYKDFIQNELEKNKTKIQKSLLGFTKEFKKVLPFKSKLLDKIVEKLDSNEEKLQEISEQQIQETAIQSTLSSIFDKQIEFTKEIESTKAAEEETRFKTQLSISKVHGDILTEISNNISSQTSFTLNIAKEYYRKSLELQMRSFYIQSDLLKVTKDYFKAFSLQFESIVKNTGLPDFVKLRNIENLKEVIRTETSKNIYENVFGSDKYLGKLKNKISMAIGNKVNDLTSKIDDLTFSLSMINSGFSDDTKGSEKLGFFANILGSLLGSTAGEKVAEKISKKYGKTIKENRYIKAGGYNLETLAKSPELFFTNLQKKASKFVSENELSDSIGKRILAKLLSPIAETNIFTPDKQDTFVSTKRDIFDINKPAIFDNKVYTSITDVIPSYLSKIYIEAKYSNAIFAKVFNKKIEGIQREKEEVYDFINNRFTSVEKYKEEIEKQIFKKTKDNRIKESSDKLSSSIVDILNKNKKAFQNKLNEKEVAKDFSNLIIKLKEEYKEEFKIEDLLNKEKLQEFKQNEKIKDLFTSNINQFFEEIDKASIEQKKSIQNVFDFSKDKFKDIESGYPIETIKRVFKSISLILRSNTIETIDLSDEEAVIIAKALSNFVFKSNAIISADSIIKGQAFAFLPSKIKEDLKNKIALFMYYTKKINNMSFEYTSKLNLLLATLNETIRSSLDLNINIFKELGRSDSNIFSGELYAENILERTLKNFDKKDTNIEVSDLIELSKTKVDKIKEIEQKNKEVQLNAFVDSIHKNLELVYGEAKTRTSKFMKVIQSKKQEISNIKTSEQLSKFILDTVDESFKAISSTLKRNYKNATDKLNEISESIKKNVTEGLNKKISEMINTISRLAENEEKNHRAKIDSYTTMKAELRNKLSNTFENEEFNSIDEKLKSIDRAIERETKLYQFKKDSFNKIIQELKNMSDISSNLNKDNIDLLKTIRNKFVEISNLYNRIAEEYEKLDSATSFI